MMIKAPQLKVARRHAQRMGKQISEMLDNDHDGLDGDVVERLLSAWATFVDQFGDSLDPARTYVADGFREGISGVNSRLTVILTP
jgi:hypothetical protein